MKKNLFSALVIAGCAALSVRAQIGGMINQVDSTQTREQLNQAAQQQLTESNAVPPLYEGESSDLGPQSVVQPMPRHTLFEARADEQLFYSDNVLLTEKNKINSAVLLSTAEFALAPTPYPLWNGMLAPRVGYQGQWVDYFLNDKRIFGLPFHLKDLDFSAQSVFADATWTRGHWSFGAGLNAMRLFNTPQADSYDPIYDELAPNWMARYVLPLCEKSAVSATYFGDYRFTSIRPQFLEFSAGDANDRTDHGLLLTYTPVFCKQVVFQPYYQMKYTHFTDYPLGPRNDYLNTVGGGLYWMVCPNFSVRTFVSYDIQSSGNRFVQDYRKFDGGGGISASIRF